MGEVTNRRPAMRFEDLVVWQRSHSLVLSIYHLSATFPKSEAFGLVTQMRRAAVSVAANIVEGFQRKSTTEKLRFMNISQGSLQELRYFLILVEDLKFGETLNLREDLAKVGRLLAAYMRGIERRMDSPS
ncbi:MAG TPA: four helix bundle protein [Kiritimatiellia bacterium]|nr:four helix bundle protein [Kiritimatiellia bacterium]